MNKASHKRKVRMARKMMTQDEIKRGIPVFSSFAWNERSLDIKNRIANNILKRKEKYAKIN